MDTVFTVVGMTCNHCVNSVSEELLKINEVTDVKVDLKTGKVNLQSKSAISQSDIAAAISEAGYELK